MLIFPAIVCAIVTIYCFVHMVNEVREYGTQWDRFFIFLLLTFAYGAGTFFMFSIWNDTL